MAPKQIQASSPNHEGPRPITLGIVVHSTRGDAATLQAEFDATLNWFAKTSSQVSAHSVAGPGVVARVVNPDLVAWHCRARNAAWLGIELTQSKLGDKLDDGVLNAAAWECANWVRAYHIPLQWSLDTGLCQHYATPEGQSDGKTDIMSPFDESDFLARIKSYL